MVKKIPVYFNNDHNKIIGNAEVVDSKIVVSFDDETVRNTEIIINVTDEKIIKMLKVDTFNHLSIEGESK